MRLCSGLICFLFFLGSAQAEGFKKEQDKVLEQIMRKLPSINEVQQSALDYNEIGPEKIIKWRKSLKYRALMPTVSLDYDKTIYGTAGGATYDGRCYVGPYDWGISVSWDLANMVWNSYEDDIDTRSRLNTQMRKYTMDKVNEAFFELVKLYLEQKSLPREKQEEKIAKELRIKELSAVLDAYTGGYFSRRAAELSVPDDR